MRIRDVSGMRSEDMAMHHNEQMRSLELTAGLGCQKAGKMLELEKCERTEFVPRRRRLLTRRAKSEYSFGKLLNFACFPQ